MKLADLRENQEKYNFVGTCVNSFDEDGDCNFPNYIDTSNFAVGEENAKKISLEQFLIHVVPHPIIKSCDEFMIDEENDVYIAYDSNKDIHYFFIKHSS